MDTPSSPSITASLPEAAEKIHQPLVAFVSSRALGSLG